MPERATHASPLPVQGKIRVVSVRLSAGHLARARTRPWCGRRAVGAITWYLRPRLPFVSLRPASDPQLHVLLVDVPAADFDGGSLDADRLKAE
jgi:hypothetical protein